MRTMVCVKFCKVLNNREKILNDVIIFMLTYLKRKDYLSKKNKEKGLTIKWQLSQKKKKTIKWQNEDNLK